MTLIAILQIDACCGVVCCGVACCGVVSNTGGYSPVMMKCGEPPTKMMLIICRPGTSSMATLPPASAIRPNCPSLVIAMDCGGTLMRMVRTGSCCRGTVDTV